MEQGLLLDTARKFWPIKDLKKLIELLSKNDFTHLQLHLSENQGFHLDIAAENSEVYTRTEITDLVNFAEALGIEIIPDIDMPGHMAALLKLKGSTEFALAGTNETALDVANPLAVEWALNILSQAAECFPESRIFHLGGDEFVDFRAISNYPELLKKTRQRFGAEASGLEYYVEFINRAAELLQEMGKTVHVWNDGLLRKDLKSLVDLNADLEICYWTRWDKGMANLSDFLDRSYKVVNFCDNDFYYVLGESAGYSYPTPEKLIREANPAKFAQKQWLTEDQMQQLQGVYFSVWADVPEAKTTQEILEDLSHLLPNFVKSIKNGQKAIK